MKQADNQLKKVRWLAGVCGLAALGMVTNVFPQWMDGDDLLRVCNSGEAGHVFKPGVCTGYLMASIDLEEGLQAQSALKAPLLCLPAEVTMPEVQDIVVEYVEGHPARKDTIASMLVVEALQNKFPCK